MDIMKKIHEVLSGDAELVALLGTNAPFFKPDGDTAKVNSIIPAGLATTSTICPFITVQQGVANKLGKKLRDETFYIRAYNKKEMAWVKINEIGERMIELLDEQVLSLDEHQMVRAKYETSMATLVDEAMDLNFREFRFRVIFL